MKSLVKNYTDQELINQMKSLPSYKYVPQGYHIIVVRSQEAGTDLYCDKLYLFEGKQCVMVIPCTSKSGRWGLFNFWKYNRKGVAVIKSDEIYYHTYQKSDGKFVRHHNNKVQCLRQILPMKYYRDGNKNDIVEEIGAIEIANNSTNVHPNSHIRRDDILSWIVGKWSLGCIVVNDLTKYWQMIDLLPYDERITLTLLKEF